MFKDISMKVGGWVQVSRKKIGKSSQNSRILVLIFWGSISSVCCVYIIRY